MSSEYLNRPLRSLADATADIQRAAFFSKPRTHDLSLTMGEPLKRAEGAECQCCGLELPNREAKLISWTNNGEWSAGLLDACPKCVEHLLKRRFGSFFQTYETKRSRFNA